MTLLGHLFLSVCLTLALIFARPLVRDAIDHLTRKDLP